MFRKHFALPSLCLILIVATIILSYQQFHFRQDPKVYSFTIETPDLRIKNIEFVVYPGSNSVYVSDHDLEIIGENKQFSSVAYGISIHGKMILSLSQANDPFTLPDASNGKITYTSRNLIRDVKVRTDDEINIEIVYKANGVTTNKVSTVKLTNIMKPFSTTGDNNNIIHL
ncbi:hypothetical protein M5X00_31035 [Paenibacillus alvei]|uniref:Uncharacterized protein n=1 Tax=Paenibacillus alvei TaxID=44250 RepID=A0ABT4H6R6_PAEAL|nr:hypothetical protein [Paenibacillus alvei]EJW15438.1 hypothetical protein PAV_8c01020 [Paenibacillus alvei DSM 29]MCY9541945.1 hypothetical protein [Paenibacillus alvei]MCY9706476.1 hypothetical protein [Paenibacillus alvei]MCY9736401.1 hypothetical protein [Paenibacillus alvei]MCY9758658.1 hypothetical protein [Paenibacillus alvei]